MTTILLTLACLCAADEPTRQDVFTSGEGGYHTYRIPAVVATPKGTLLAFAEGRKDGRADAGNIDTLLRRSTDGGGAWLPVQLVADDEGNTFGNPCPVIDRTTGTVFLLLTHNLGSDTEEQIKAGAGRGTRTVWVAHSTDDGVTWSRPAEITSTVKEADWSWYATGPGIGIQLASGRLLIPCDHRVRGQEILRSHAIYSDDHGRSWRLGGLLADKTNECQAVELADGAVMMNMRSYHGRNRRAVATSRDGGLTWSDIRFDEALIEPVCQASLLRYSLAMERGKNRLLFSNPASKRRENLTIRLSYDEGQTWAASKLLHPGYAAYSCLVVLPDGRIGCLYERDRYAAIEFATFSLDWLTDGNDRGATANSPNPNASPSE